MCRECVHLINDPVPIRTLCATITTDGIDFVFNNTQLVIDERSVRECVIFTIINDEASEGGETLQAYLSLVYVLTNGTINNDSVVALTVDQANITIFDSIGKAIILRILESAFVVKVKEQSEGCV